MNERIYSPKVINGELAQYNMAEMKSEAAPWLAYRNNKNAIINWPFSVKDARIKFPKLYLSFKD
jgi:hypothetical protein